MRGPGVNSDMCSRVLSVPLRGPGCGFSRIGTVWTKLGQLNLGAQITLIAMFTDASTSNPQGPHLRSLVFGSLGRTRQGRAD